MDNQSIDTKCFLVNVFKKDFKFDDKWGRVNFGEDRDLQKVYDSYNKKTNVLKNEIIYSASFQQAENKVSEIVKEDMKVSADNLIKERALLESETIRSHLIQSLLSVQEKIKNSHFDEVLKDLNWSKDRSERYLKHYEKEINDKPFGEATDEFIQEQANKKKAEEEKLDKVCKEIETVNQRKSVLENEVKKISNQMNARYSKWYDDEKRWHEETAKTLYEDLGKIIKDDNEEDYEIQIKELKYIVLKSDSEIGLSEQVNDHLVKGWEVLGGVQIAGSGGGDGSMRNWSEYQYVQSLVCGS